MQTFIRRAFAEPKLLAISVAVIVSTYLAEVLLHESTHALTALALGYEPVLHATYVDSIPETLGRDLAIIAAAGPVMSAAIGTIGFRLHRRAQTQMTRMIAAWIALVGTFGWLGYLLITPIEADTGIVVYSIFGESTVGYVVAAVMVLVAILLIRKFMDTFASMIVSISDSTFETEKDAKAWTFRNATLPWFLAMPFIVFPIGSGDAILGSIVPVMYGFPLFMAWGAATRKRQSSLALASPANTKLATGIGCVAVAIVMIVLNQTVLSSGLQL